MKVSVLSQNERAALGFTHRALITLADLTGSAAGATAALTLLPTGKIGWHFRNAVINVKTAGAHASTLTLSVGDTNSATRLLGASDVKAAAGTRYVGSTQYIYNTAYAVNCTFTAGAGDANAATAGEWEILLDIVDLTQTANT
jgi:hypothetical protein